MVEADEGDDDGLASSVPKARTPNGKQTGLQYTVLLVEDDRVTCKIVADSLKSCRYNVVQAENGRVALDILESEQGRQIDLILTDNMMPEVTGLELIDRLVGVKQREHLPVIVMSSDCHQDTAFRALKAGASEFLSKPIKKEKLLTLWKHACSARKAVWGAAQYSMQKLGENGSGRLQRGSSEEPFQMAQKSAFQPLKNGKRSGGSLGAGLVKRMCLPQQPDRIVDIATILGALQRLPNSAVRNGSQILVNQAVLGGNAGSQLQARQPLFQAGGPMRNASWPPFVGPVTGSAFDLQPNPLLSRQALFGSWQQYQQQNSSGNGLEIKPLLRIEKLASPINNPQSSVLNPGAAKKQPELNHVNGLKPSFDSLDTLRHSTKASAFRAVSSRVDAVCHAQVSSPISSRHDETALPQQLGPQPQSHHLACLPMAPGLNLPLLMTPLLQHAFMHPPVRQKATSTSTANRKAAIERFRAKRNQRSFEKKVRYTSRQRLAETRPRVKGQFVKVSLQNGELKEATPSEVACGKPSEAQQ